MFRFRKRPGPKIQRPGSATERTQFRKSVTTRRCETKPPGSGEVWRNVLIPTTFRPSDRTTRHRDETKPFRKSATTRRCETKPPGFGEVWRNTPIPAASRPSDRTTRHRDETKPFPKFVTTRRCETKPPGFGENREVMTVGLKGGPGGVPRGCAKGFGRTLAMGRARIAWRTPANREPCVDQIREPRHTLATVEMVSRPTRSRRPSRTPSPAAWLLQTPLPVNPSAGHGLSCTGLTPRSDRPLSACFS